MAGPRSPRGTGRLLQTARDVKMARTMAGPYAQIGGARGRAARGPGPDCMPSAPPVGGATRGRR